MAFVSGNAALATLGGTIAADREAMCDLLAALVSVPTENPPGRAGRFRDREAGRPSRLLKKPPT